MNNMAIETSHHKHRMTVPMLLTRLFLCCEKLCIQKEQGGIFCNEFLSCE